MELFRLIRLFPWRESNKSGIIGELCRIIRHLGSGIVNANDSATLSAAELGVVDCVTESTGVQRRITAVKRY